MDIAVIITEKLSNIFRGVTTRMINIVPGFTRNTAFQWWSIAICLSFIISLLLTPQIHFTHPHYKVGSIANKDIKADRDFLVEERAATEHKKLASLQDILSIYDYDSDKPALLRTNLNNAFLLMEEGSIGGNKLTDVTSQAGGKEFSIETKKDFERLSGITLTNEEFNVLRKQRFSTEIVNETIKLITAVYGTGLITDATFTKRDIDKGIIIWDVRAQNEINVFLSDERKEKSTKHPPFLRLWKKSGDALEGKGPSKIWHVKHLESILLKKATLVSDRTLGEHKGVVVF
ncbi:MAG: hypothetical protein Q7J12_09220, partial [Syntrophales bacterium]|nr:hypothetical protein [Syntrophales bacterium]